MAEEERGFFLQLRNRQSDCASLLEFVSAKAAADESEDYSTCRQSLEEFSTMAAQSSDVLGRLLTYIAGVAYLYDKAPLIDESDRKDASGDYEAYKYICGSKFKHLRGSYKTS